MVTRGAAATILVVAMTAGCQTLKGPSRAASRPPSISVASTAPTPTPLRIDTPPTARSVAPTPVVPTAAVAEPPSDIRVAPAVAATPTPVRETPADPASSLRAIHQRAVASYAQMDGYAVRLKRREMVGGTTKPEEMMLAKIRKEPFSVYFKWLGEEGKGREVCYVQGRHENLIHTLMAPGDLFLFGGKVFKIAPDSPLVRSKSRYPITEAGYGPLIARVGRLASALERSDPSEGTASLLGMVKRPEFDEPLEAVLQTLPPGADPHLPNGGRRWWHFDPRTGLPALIVTHDERDREVEYYCHDRLQFPVRFDDDDFDPAKLFKK